MYKVQVSDIIDIFNKISKQTHNQLVELSIKKSRINFEFNEPSVIYINDIIDLLEDDFINQELLYFTALDGHIHLTYECGDIVMHDNIPKNSIFKSLFDLLTEIGEHICQCPALEYVISKDYIKVFIDKPNIESSNLFDLEKVFGQQFTLELQKQRPYCLFVNIKDEAQTTLDANNTTTYVGELNVVPDILTSDMVRKI